MSLRERWIVYPLLFLTLGIALRDKVIPPAHSGNFNMNLKAGSVVAPRIQCSELVCDQMKATQTQCNTMLVVGPNGQPVVVARADNKGHAGVVETFTAEGLQQVRLMSSNVGGMMSALERDGKLALILGDTGENVGLFAEVPGVSQLIPLTLPWRFENKPIESRKPETSKDSTAPSKPGK
jgi:hypothetical protein